MREHLGARILAGRFPPAQSARLPTKGIKIKFCIRDGRHGIRALGPIRFLLIRLIPIWFLRDQGVQTMDTNVTQRLLQASYRVTPVIATIAKSRFAAIAVLSLLALAGFGAFSGAFAGFYDPYGYYHCTWMWGPYGYACY